VSSPVVCGGLECFFVFDPSLGDEETEGEKILYFFPPNIDLNRQKDYVGISEALVNFSRSHSFHV